MKRSFIEHAVRGGLLASILAAAGCSGRVNIGDDSRGLGDEVSGSGGFDSTADGGPLGHSGGSAGRSGDSDASLSAKCAEPPSSVLLYSFPREQQATFATRPELYSALAGRWYICEGHPFAIPADVIGLEFGDVTWQDIDRVNGGKATIPDVPTGTLYLLVAGPDGLIRGTGAEYEYTYYLSPGGTDEVAPFPTLLAMVQADSWMATSVAYSGRPRQWRIGSTDPTPIGSTDPTPHPGWLLVPAD